MSAIIARNPQLDLLQTIWTSKNPEFLVIYGRKRVGKKFLIREFFKKKDFYFELTGLRKGNLKRQLKNFAERFSETFHPGLPIESPKNWHDALKLLLNEINKVPNNMKITIFFDELPWLATKKSGLIQEIDYFWNNYFSKMNNIVFILCGSAASWMLEKVIHDKGGLHNRLTRQILLKPFTLKETKEFVDKNKLNKNKKQILDLYMLLGGVPLYLQQIKRSHSATHNIQNICFDESGILYDEFEKLYRSLFKSHHEYINIIRAISKKHSGISVNELLKTLKKRSGGYFFKKLEELESAGFIQKYIYFGKTTRNQYYRVIDEYTIFYFNWLEKFLSSEAAFSTKNYWTSRVNTPEWLAWSVYAFENICYKHTFCIKKALGIENIACTVSTWQYIPKKRSKESGAQIDLLFDREDGIITLCKIKYSKNDFFIDKNYAKKLANKIKVFEERTKTKKQIMLVLITVSGLKDNIWKEDLVDQVITLDNLFE